MWLDSKTGTISGIPTREANTTTVIIYGKNQSGNTSCSIRFSAKRGICQEEDIFHSVYLGEVSVYYCSQNGPYLGVRRRACVFSQWNVHWDEPTGFCLHIGVLIVAVVALFVFLVATVIACVKYFNYHGQRVNNRNRKNRKGRKRMGSFLERNRSEVRIMSSNFSKKVQPSIVDLPVETRNNDEIIEVNVDPLRYAQPVEIIFSNNAIPEDNDMLIEIMPVNVEPLLP